MSSSSSTTSTLPLVPAAVKWGAVISSDIHRLPRRAGHGEGKLEPERGAAARPVRDFDGAAMLLNDTVSHREAEAGALAHSLGGEERIVDAVHVLGGDAMSRIGHFGPGSRAFRPGAHFQRSAGRHGVAGIQEEVEKHLLKLAGVAVHGPKAGVEIGLDLDSRLLKLVLQQRERLLNHAVQVYVGQRSRRGSGKVEQRIDDLAG